MRNPDLAQTTQKLGFKGEVSWAAFGADEAGIAEELEGFKLHHHDQLEPWRSVLTQAVEVVGGAR